MAESLAPQTDEYKALSQASCAMPSRRARAAAADPDDKPIKPGARDTGSRPSSPCFGPAGTCPIRAGSRRGQPQAAPTTYTPALVAAVKQFQADSGTKPDGVLGRRHDRCAQHRPGRTRARQLAVAMERLRWLPRNPPGTRIDVNTAASFLDYWRDGQHVDHRKVINGESDKPTPQLQAPIFQLVAKPTWTVPKGIGEKELADKSPGLAQDNGFV